MASTTTITTEAAAAPSISLVAGQRDDAEQYRYKHLLPHFSQDHYPPLTPFDHLDPGARALEHPDPRAFLRNATSVVELTPRLGSEITGVNLATLDSAGRDELALEASQLLVTEIDSSLLIGGATGLAGFPRTARVHRQRPRVL